MAQATFTKQLRTAQRLAFRPLLARGTAIITIMVTFIITPILMIMSTGTSTVTVTGTGTVTIITPPMRTIITTDWVRLALQSLA